MSGLTVSKPRCVSGLAVQDFFADKYNIDLLFISDNSEAAAKN